MPRHKTNNPYGLTDKQEAFCQAYIICLNQSEAYRQAYNAEKMKPETVNRMAFDLMQNHNIAARIADLQKETVERNKITIDEIVTDLATIHRIDPTVYFDDQGQFLPIKAIPADARKAIVQMEFDQYGNIRRLKLVDKSDVTEKLMKHLGGYQKDNQQKQVEVVQKMVIATPDGKELTDFNIND